jgi:hypothetical protein
LSDCGVSDDTLQTMKNLPSSRVEDERERRFGDDRSDAERVATHYPYWLIVGGFAVFAIVMLFLAYVVWST